MRLEDGLTPSSPGRDRALVGPRRGGQRYVLLLLGTSPTTPGSLSSRQVGGPRGGPRGLGSSSPFGAYPPRRPRTRRPPPDRRPRPPTPRAPRACCARASRCQHRRPGMIVTPGGASGACPPSVLWAQGAALSWRPCLPRRRAWRCSCRPPAPSPDRPADPDQIASALSPTAPGSTSSSRPPVSTRPMVAHSSPSRSEQRQPGAVLRRQVPDLVAELERYLREHD